MTGAFLMRGLIAGLVAGILAFGFARTIGEPQVNLAIAFESKLAAERGEAPEPVLVSRDVQSSWGLLTAVVVYGTALGGLFSLVFASLVGRIGAIGPRNLAALIALAAFISIALLPALKYPPNPPSVGQPETIAYRTELYFLMLAASIAAVAFAVWLARRLVRPMGTWNAVIAAGAVLIIMLVVVTAYLPDINEVPASFPAVVLWRFRLASLGLQALIWTVIGLGFGWLAERQLTTSTARVNWKRA